MNTMFRRPMITLHAISALLAAAFSTPKGYAGSDFQDSTSSRPARRMRITPQRFRQRMGMRVPDDQKQASLRRRMGGNAMRITMARDGYIFTDKQVEGQPLYELSPRVLPEEVEARVKVCDYRRQFWDPSAPVRTTIRGMEVEIYPTFCGPVRFKQLEAA